MNLYAVMWAKGFNEWEICNTLDDNRKKVLCVYKTKRAAEEELNKWVEQDGPDNYKVAKLDVVVMG